MRKIPAALNAQFDALLVKMKIPQRFHSHYFKWLRYYLDFCQRYRFSESNPRSLANFIRKLKEKRQTDAQQKQANEAIHIYYELIRSKTCNNKSELPKHPPKPEGVSKAQNIVSGARHSHEGGNPVFMATPALLDSRFRGYDGHLCGI